MCQCACVAATAALVVPHRARLSIDITAAERRRIRMAATRRDESIRDYVMRAIESQLTADLESANLTALTDTAADESPSFAPNSRLIVYATQQQGREALMTTTLDGKIKARLPDRKGLETGASA